MTPDVKLQSSPPPRIVAPPSHVVDAGDVATPVKTNASPSQSQRKPASPVKSRLVSVQKPRSTAAGRRQRAKEAWPTEADVLFAVESLYDDELIPYGRILRKRLAEYAPSTRANPEVDAGRLRALCLASASCSLREEEGGEWSVRLTTGRPEAFVDVYCPLDRYPAALWAAAAEYFAGPECDSLELPGGRYACAQVLSSRCLPFLGGRSLGEICHFVQLAISHKKLLGYLNGSVVPYRNSQSMVKDLCAAARQCAVVPTATSGATGMSGAALGADSAANLNLPLASWEAAHVGLQKILEDSRSAGLEPVPLSNVKRLFRTMFQLELSETSLGHSKLSELLQDARLSDVCEVQLQGKGYVVVPRFPPGATVPPPSNMTATEMPAPQSMPTMIAAMPMATPTAMPSVAPSCSIGMFQMMPSSELSMPPPEFNASNWCCGAEAMPTEPPLPPPPPKVPTPTAFFSMEGREGYSQKNTFIHVVPPPSPPLVGARRRARSLPKEVGSELFFWEAAFHTYAFLPRSLESSNSEPAARTPTALSLSTPSPVFPPVPLPTATADGRPRFMAQMDDHMTLTLPELLQQVCQEDREGVTEGPQQSVQKFCPDEPLCLEDAGYCEKNTSGAVAAGVPGRSRRRYRRATAECPKVLSG
eukprot:gnl/TRDRNA2_/TRDRNA2_166161_c0_seq1.p1 gnl/TRDRNA2_/TRDRNA2_166161_c0~~gnl/TRDRNA2_/TRDRNA2_166161_c0_seq1.p1  ORF type:complete len:711 (+),score=96.92 gnl/TRDRNA2_/TRDRNA2_166161_c0_seq1:198-2135(+)